MASDSASAMRLLVISSTSRNVFSTLFKPLAKGFKRNESNGSVLVMDSAASLSKAPEVFERRE